MRSRFGKLTLVLVFLIGGTIAAIEFANSDLLMESKTYELVGYGEVDRKPSGDNVLVIKSKRFGFLPGAETVVFVQDITGKTIEARSLPTLSTDASDMAVPTQNASIDEPATNGTRL